MINKRFFSAGNKKNTIGAPPSGQVADNSPLGLVLVTADGDLSQDDTVDSSDKYPETRVF